MFHFWVNLLCLGVKLEVGEEITPLRGHGVTSLSYPGDKKASLFLGLIRILEAVVGLK